MICRMMESCCCFVELVLDRTMKRKKSSARVSYLVPYDTCDWEEVRA